MANVTDHPVLPEELKEEIHENEVISKPTEVDKVIEDKPIVENSPCLTEEMPLNSETKSPAIEVEKTEAKIDDNIELKSSETRDFVPETAEKEPEPAADITEKKEDVSEPVAEIAENEKIDVKPAESEEKKENEPKIPENSIPADEIAEKKEEKPIVVHESVQETKENEPKVECSNETVIEKEIPEEKPVTDVPKETAEGTETDKTTLEQVKTESATKEEEKTTPKSNNIFGKVKKSLIKAKKAIIGKNNPKTTETKEDEKA